MEGASVQSGSSTWGIDRSRAAESAHRGLRWVADRRLVLVLGLVAAVPVLVSTVRAVDAGWTPVFDDGVMATRAFDVLSTHSPLVGASSNSTVGGVGLVFDPGPLLFWLLAFQARFLGDWALPVTMGLVNIASIVGVVALARRRGGQLFMFATAIALVVMCRSLPQAALCEIDASRAGLPAFTLLLFLAWSVACGEYRLLPLMVVVASFIAQVHLAFALPGLAVFVIALAGLARSLSRSHGAGAIATGEHRRRWLLGALAVALVCWSAPLLDQAFNSPGNLSRIVQTATAQQKTLGPSAGWHALVSTIGIWPRWLQSYPGSEEVGLVSQNGGAPVSQNGAAVASSVLILGALSIIAVFGLRRRRPDVVTAAALALALNGAVVVYTASTPSRLWLNLSYGLRWTSPAGMFAWLALGWSVAALLRPTRSRAVDALRTLPARRPAFLSVVGLAITAILAFWVTTGPESDSDSPQWSYRPARTVSSLLAMRLPRGRAVLVRESSSSGYAGWVFQTAILYQLRRRGYRVVAPSDISQQILAQKLGAYYEPGGIGSTHRRYDDVLLVDVSNQPVVPLGARVIARVPLHGVPGNPVENQPPPMAITVSVHAASGEAVGVARP